MGEWEQFKTQYQKHYANDAEELERYGLFKNSKARVAKLNALNPEPVFGITSMSDRHPEEQFKKYCFTVDNTAGWSSGCCSNKGEKAKVQHSWLMMSSLQEITLNQSSTSEVPSPAIHNTQR